MNTHVQIAEIERIANMLAPHYEGDEQLFHDMMTCESPVDQVAARIWEQVARDTETLAGIKDRKANLDERKKRIEQRVAAGKKAIGDVLRAAKLLKLELPEVTLSVRDGKAGLQVIDPEAVPDEFCDFKRVPRKTEINAAFDPDGDLPNWLIRTEPHDVITGRTK